YWTNDGPDRNSKSFGEIEIALIVRRNGHDRARAIVDQHEIAHPDGNFLATVRIDGVMPREYAVLDDVSRTHLLARINHLPSLRAARIIEELLRERMLRRQDQASGAVDGIDAR